jgi:hypothetical protein
MRSEYVRLAARLKRVMKDPDYFDFTAKDVADLQALVADLHGMIERMESDQPKAVQSYSGRSDACCNRSR